MAARTVRCTLVNLTDETLRREEQRLWHGIWTPDDQPPPLQTEVLEWASESNGILTGTEGDAVYRGDHGTVTVHWNNPYVGKTRADALATGQYHVVDVKVEGDKEALVRVVISRTVVGPYPEATPAAEQGTAAPPAASTASLPEDHHAGEGELDKDIKLSPREPPVPVLSLALLNAPAGEDTEFKTEIEKKNKIITLDPTAASFQDDVSDLLTHLHQRLTKGLEEAWRSDSYGYGGKPLDTPEEQWARAVSEVYLQSAYGGTSIVYGMAGEGGKADKNFYDRMSLADDAGNDPAFAIVLACQHLASLLLISRGVTVADLTTGPIIGLGCSGANSGVPVFAKNGRWVGKSTEVKNGDALGNQENSQARQVDWLVKDQKITPGSMFTFNGAGPTYTGQDKGKAHIGGILRVVNGGLQTFDTGVLVPGGLDGAGTADHKLLPGTSKETTEDGKPKTRGATVPGLEGALVGVGIAPELTPTKEHIALLRKARPLGFARLFLTEKKDGNEFVRFYSRLLPMHDGDDNFPISRYMWSLRGIPATLDRTGLLWVLSCPNNADVTFTLRAKGARSLTLDQLMQNAAARGASATPARKLYGSLLNQLTITHILRAGDTLKAPPILERHHLDKTQKWGGVVSKDAFPPSMRKILFDGSPAASLPDRWSKLGVNESGWWDGTKYVADAGGGPASNVSYFGPPKPAETTKPSP